MILIFLKIQLKSVSLLTKRIRKIKTTKNRCWRTVPINTELKKLLLHLQLSRKGEYVLPRLREWERGYQAAELKKFLISIGIRPIKFHGLRACFATQLLQRGATETLKFPTTTEALGNEILSIYKA